MVQNKITLAIIFLLITAFLGCSSSGGEAAFVPDDLPDSGPPPTDEDELEKCCECLSGETISLNDVSRKCFEGETAGCIEYMKSEGGIIAPSECLRNLCEKQCGFLILEEG